MKITKDQLRKIVKEETLQELEARQMMGDEEKRKMKHPTSQERLDELEEMIEDIMFMGNTNELKKILTYYLNEL